MIRIVSPGSFRKTTTFLDRLKRGDFYKGLDEFGRRGVEALSSVTPFDTGRTAEAWTYGIEKTRRGLTIYWNNTNDNKGTKIAILLQYGHGTGTGGYIVGRDYINPALRPIFDQMAKEVWKKVTHG